MNLVARKLCSGFYSTLRKIGVPSQFDLAKEIIISEIVGTEIAKVLTGPFTGMILDRNQTWGDYDFLPKLLGTYELQIVEYLNKICSSGNMSMLNLGSADGYFALGALRAGWVDRCVCFETSEKSRRAILRLAKKNALSKELVVNGKIDSKLFKHIVASNAFDIILCDIEGAEFSLFDSEALALLKRSFVVIELHDSFNPALKGEKTLLIENAERNFNIRLVRNTDSFLSIPIMNKFSDDYRLLAYSEGRPCEMEWLILEPKNFKR